MCRFYSKKTMKKWRTCKTYWEPRKLIQKPIDDWIDEDASENVEERVELMIK